MALFRHVLVATDFSQCSERALELGIKTADALGAELTIVHAWDVPAYVYTNPSFIPSDVVTPILDAAKDQLKEAGETARQVIPNAAVMLRQGVAWREILAAREELGADVIVIGTHGRTGLAHVFLGSVAEHVVRSAPVPVITVHASTPLPRMAREDTTSTPPAPPMF
jgi:nucleotide-binding universal stress UspA family protein